jgi:hypothetical protein
MPREKIILACGDCKNRNLSGSYWEPIRDG